jgi:two-component system, LytTR family, sensor kinase
MEQQVIKTPYKKIIRLALLTTPCMALLGSFPSLIQDQFEISHVAKQFSFLMIVIFFIWAINLYLTYLATSRPWLQNPFISFTIALCILIAVIVCTFQMIINSALPLELGPKPIFNIPLPKRFILAPIAQLSSMQVVVFILIRMLTLNEHRMQVIVENQQLRYAHLEAKMSTLKQQLQPHFLFNSLSVLRSMVTRSPEKALFYIEQLADLLRHSVTNQQSLVPLSEELSLCSNYLNMQKIRFGEALTFEIDIPKELMPKYKVPVYSLQQLSENAIKHNILTLEQPLKIDIKMDPKSDTIIVSNNLQKREHVLHKAGTGLDNLRSRYKLLGYQGVETINDSKNFMVRIQLIPHDSNHH